MALALSVLMPILPSKEKRGTIAKSDHLVYSVIGSIGNKKVQGVVGIKVVSVKGDEFTVDILPKGVPFMNKARLTFPGNGDELSDLGGVIAGWSSRYDGERLGKESLPTPFGPKDVEHYMRIEEKENGTLKSDQYVDPIHHLPLGARLSGKSGDVLFSLIETNLEWIKEGK